jgi:DNA polymerase-3 subunit delta'
MRAAFVQGSSKARGQFTDVLDAMTVLLHERSRDAARAGDRVAAAASARGVRIVEEAKRSAEGNVSPQLLTARLLGQLSEAGA